MAAKPVCLVCEVEMEKGFVSDLGEAHSANVPRWSPGEPDKTFFKLGEVPNAQHKKGLPIVAFRCPECEALRLYAPSEAT